MKPPVPLPDGLATMSPGPKLAAVLASIAPESVSGFDSVEVARAVQRQENAATAAKLRWVVEVALRRQGHLETVSRLQIPHEFAVEEIAAMYGLSSRAADKLLDLAWATYSRLPQLQAAMAAGGLDETRAWALAEWTAELSDEHANAVVDELLPRAVLDAEEQLPTNRLIKEATKKAMALDPTWALRRMKEGLRRKRVIGYMNKDGTATISGQNLDPARAAAACGRMDALAASSKNAGNPRPIDHIRADLLIALLDGTYEGLTDAQILQVLAAEFASTAEDETDDQTQTQDEDSTRPDSDLIVHPDTGPVEPTEPSEPGAPAGAAQPMGSPHIGVQLRIRLTTLLGLDRCPAELSGWTPIPHTHGTDQAALMGAAQWRYTLTDDDGHFLGCGLITARPYGYDRRAARNEGIVDILVPATLLREVVIDPTKGAHLIDPTVLARWMPVLAQLTDLMRNPKPLPDDTDKRFPGRGLRRKIQLRKPRCIGVGCGRASRASEIDHRLDWALGGRTRDINLDPECGRHHTVKTKGGWSVHRWRTHGYRWCSPLGREYITTLPRIIEPMPPPAGPDIWWEEPEPAENPDLDINGNPWQETKIWFSQEPKPDPPPKPEPPPRPVDLEEPPF